MRGQEDSGMGHKNSDLTVPVHWQVAGVINLNFRRRMSQTKLLPGVFAFLKAAESGDDKAVEKYLDDGGDIHAADDGNNTALHLV